MKRFDFLRTCPYNPIPYASGPNNSYNSVKFTNSYKYIDFSINPCMLYVFLYNPVSPLFPNYGINALITRKKNDIPQNLKPE